MYGSMRLTATEWTRGGPAAGASGIEGTCAQHTNRSGLAGATGTQGLGGRTARGTPSGGASSKRLRRSAGGQSVLAASASRSVPSAYLHGGDHAGMLGKLATTML